MSVFMYVEEKASRWEMLGEFSGSEVKPQVVTETTVIVCPVQRIAVQQKKDSDAMSNFLLDWFKFPVAVWYKVQSEHCQVFNVEVRDLSN